MGKRICDKCRKFEVSMCGTRETCHAKKEGSKFIQWMTDEYISNRINGEIQNCKGYAKI